MAYTFDAARRATLARRWHAMKVLRQGPEFEKTSRAIIAHKGIYDTASRMTGVPWWLIAVIDMREGGVGHLGTRHLHCGDPLTNYTTHVPAGRPKVGHGPPFSWLESAVDALKLKGFDKIKNWTIERGLHEAEPYNGLGYFNKGIPSPYIWSCTNQYDPPFGPGGKYVADHVFDAHVVDTQLGIAPLIAKLAEITGTKVASELDEPSAAHPIDVAKQATGPVVIVTGTAGAATAAHQSGVPIWMIALGVAAVVAIWIGYSIWRSRK